MDVRRFDQLARALGRPASRRGILGVLGGALAAVGWVTGGAAAPRPGDPKCCAQLHARAVQLCKSERAPDGKGACRVHAYACIQILAQDPDSCSLHELQCISNSGLCH